MFQIFKKPSLAVFALTTVLAFAPQAFAGQATTPLGAAFAGVCAGNTIFSGLPDPGATLNNGLTQTYSPNSYVTCATSTSAVGGLTSVSASNSGNFFGNPWSNTADAMAQAKHFHLDATNFGDSDTEFSGGSANAGWNEQFTLTATTPGIVNLNSGSGFWVVPITVDGILSVGGTASARVELGVYEDHNVVQPYGDATHQAAWNFFNANNVIRTSNNISSWDYQLVQWWADSTLPTVNVNGTTVLFALPFTWNNLTSTATLNLGFYGAIQASSGSFGGDTTGGVATIDFGHTFGWGGPGYIMMGGTTVDSSQFTVSGVSGANYETAYSPEPGTAAVLFLGLGAVAFLKRRRVRG